ncbi:MAG: AsnC family transcriptional regulator [Pirellulaceae bacterium]|nr:AsnC family transcriptional regulator [Pirellulaceae bacterium]
MTTEIESSDIALLDLLRKQGAMGVAQLAMAMGVTATAVRQRLTRLLARGDLERSTEQTGRGRPVHRYALTEKGRRRAGANFADLAIALWQEIREIKDPEVRRGLLARISKRLATLYADQIRGSNLDEKMESLANLFRERQIPFEVDRSHDLPVLHASACPYPELAEQDRSVCSMERMMFSELLGENVRLSNCRLDGHNCCTFESAEATPNQPITAIGT